MSSPSRPLALLAALLTLAGCAAGAGQGASPAVVPSASPAVVPSAGSISADTTAGPVTDYHEPGNWMLVPASPDKPVDVFYIHPTSYSRADATAPVVADINDAGMRKGAQSAYERQASAFAPVANVYAPYYRQLDAVWALTLPAAEHVQAIEGAPTIDVTAAFAYYLEHFNDGRPFAIAGHSQGSDVATHLLAGYLTQHPDVAKRMVVAYVVGYSVTQDWLDANPAFPFADGATDTGVIASWNTEAPTIASANPVVLPGALVINPISWTRTDMAAPASSSKGAWLPDANGTWGKVEQYADAAIDLGKGVLVASTPDVERWSPGGPNAWPKGVYHTFDYPFYYFDIQANLADRIASYLGGAGS